MNRIPAFEEVLDELAQVFPAVYSALEVGIVKTKEYIAQEEREDDKKRNRSFAPCLIRYQAINALEKNNKGITIVDEPDVMSVEDVANNGLMISYGKYNVRILKSNNGELPTPGHSKRRQAYYNQQFCFDFHYKNVESELEYPDKINLLILWNINKDYILDELSLAYPKTGGYTKASVDSYWHGPIPDSLLFRRDVATNTKKYDLPLSTTTSKNKEQK